MKLSIEYQKGENGEGGGVKGATPLLQRFFPKYEEVKHGWHKSFQQLFL